MNLYKRIFKDVGGFQNLSEGQAVNLVYLEKQKYFPIYVLKFLINPKRILKTLPIFMIVFVAELAVIIPLGVLDLTVNPIIVIIVTITIIIAYFYLICLVYVQIQLNKRKNNEEKEKFTDSLEEKVGKIFFLNHRVISKKSWNILKKDKKLYSYLRSKETNHHCYEDSHSIASLIKDPEVKIIWMGATDIVNGHKFGHAVLKKDKYIYDTNERGTYKYEKYIELYQAEIFKEFSMEEYENGKLFKDWDLFLQWCKERGIKRSIED